MKFKTAYSPREASKTNIDFSEIPTLTVQEQAESTDINRILRRFQKTGLIEHVNKHQAQYGDFTGVDYQTALNQVREVENTFMQLPANVRAEFNHDPQEWLEHIATPENVEDMKDGVIDNPVNIEEGAEPAPEPVQE